jgi:hypothetical protein
MMKAAAFYYDIPTPPWALIMDIDMNVGEGEQAARVPDDMG